MQIRQLALNIDSQQLPRLTSPKAIGKQPEKRYQLPAQCCNLFQRHLDGPPCVVFHDSCKNAEDRLFFPLLQLRLQKPFLNPVPKTTYRR
jgi:hypothetical protein